MIHTAPPARVHKTAGDETPGLRDAAGPAPPDPGDPAGAAPVSPHTQEAADASEHLRERIAVLEGRLRRSEEQRRAFLHILGDLHEVNKRLSDQRKATLHILVDYEQDRRHLAAQTERLDNSRRALMHIIQDSHQSNLRLEASRKAMIHIMGDLHETTAEIQRREQELRAKQEQLVQAGKLATLGELTTGVAHELNNPLNNIGLFLGNVIDLVEMGGMEPDRLLRDLRSATTQVHKATEIITHLRTFGRAAPVSREPVNIHEVIDQALSLMQEQFRLRQIRVVHAFAAPAPVVSGSSIQLEQVFINLLTNARDALMDVADRRVEISTSARPGWLDVVVSDSGTGIPDGLEQRIFDPFFTTKGVGKGTGLGLSITYGILKDHGGGISVLTRPGWGATFLVQLPLAGLSSPGEDKPKMGGRRPAGAA